MALTTKQKRLLTELDQLSKLFSVDPAATRDIPSSFWRTTRLELIKRQVIRSQIIHWYTFTDELLACRIALHFFGKSRPLATLWRSKRFQRFNHYILDEQNLLQKLRLAHAIKPIPKPIAADINRLNSLRNGMAHSFFPENRRAHDLTWKSHDVFSIAGATAMNNDVQAIFDHFFPEIPYAYAPPSSAPPAPNLRTSGDALTEK